MNQREETGPPKSPNVVIEIIATLEDLYIGKDFEILQRRQILCPRCRGSGAKNPEDVKKCSVCGGTGTRIITQTLGPGFTTKTQTTCDKCNGKGKTVTSTCPYCSGSKISHGDQMIRVVIERGMNEGHQIVYYEEGDEHPERLPGDVILKIVTPDHKRFTRIGPDLYMDFTITLLQALVGFEKTFKHLDGHVVTVTRSEITKPGYILTIPKEGMPIHEQTAFGDLHITFNIRFPTTLTLLALFKNQNLVSVQNALHTWLLKVMVVDFPPARTATTTWVPTAISQLLAPALSHIVRT